MKSFLKLFTGFALLLLGAVVAQATDNVLLGVASMPVAGYVWQTATGLSVVSGESAFYMVLAAIPKTAQGAPNPGGIRKIFLIATDQITGEWPKRSLIEEGELDTAPTLASGTPSPTFVEAAISDNSGKADSSLKGAVGYQSWEHGLELKIAGFTKVQCAAIEKLLNTEVIAVCLLNDGTRVVYGSSYTGLNFEIMHTTGAKGSDRKEWTCKAKQDGYMHGGVILADSVTLPGVAA